MFTDCIAWIFESAVQPALHALGLMGLAEQTHAWLWLAIVGLGYCLLLIVTLAPLERWRPVEPVTDRAAIRTDRWYTLLMQIGFFPLLPAALLVVLFDPVDAWLRELGFSPWSLEQTIPALREYPALAFLMYVIIIDFVNYWLHRSQHVFRPLWEMHAIHHSQQQMTYWSDTREHVLSFVYYAIVVAFVGLIIGAGRESAYVVAAFAVRYVQALSHANVRVSFGAIGNRLIVSPQFHRVHHAIGIGHEGPQHGCNFASVFAIWDVMFGTANLRDIYPRTGVRDQLSGRDYGRTLLVQQWLALKRVFGREAVVQRP
jgi:sterol desaturase/sphingolipid hydroxylase (fatty acid hydroxylase superfamily)